MITFKNFDGKSTYTFLVNGIEKKTKAQLVRDEKIASREYVEIIDKKILKKLKKERAFILIPNEEFFV